MKRIEKKLASKYPLDGGMKTIRRLFIFCLCLDLIAAVLVIPSALAADGEFAVYREATGTEALGFTNTDHTWDTTVTQGAGFTIDGGRSLIDLADGGHYLVLYNIGMAGGSGRRRSEVQSWLNLGGADLVYGRTTGYLRRVETYDAWPFGAAIINASAGNDLKLISISTDDQTALTSDRIANASGMMLLKLSESWDYARIREATGGQAFSSTTFTALTFDTNDELDTGSFTHTGDTASITLKTAGHYLVTYNVMMQTSGTARTSATSRLTLDGSEMNGTRVYSYMRGTDSTNDNSFSFAGIIETGSANQVLQVQIYEETGSNPVAVGGQSAITIVKLPDTGDYVRLVKTGNLAVDGTGVSVSWDSEAELDAASFGHAGAQVNIDQDGDYLFLSTFWSNRSNNGGREYPHWEWRKNGAKYSYGSGGKFGRGSSSLESGNSLGLIAHGLTSTDYIDIVSTNEGTGTDSDSFFQANRMALQGVNLGSLFDTTPPTNPTAPAGGWDVPAKTNALTDNAWQGAYNSAYFEWSGATDSGTGVSGYSTYFGTDVGGEPGTSQEQVDAFLDAGTVGGEGIYHLRLRTFDGAGNYSDPITLFTLKYDGTAPSSNPTAPAGGWETSSKITALTNDTWQKGDDTPYFEWSGAADAASGVSGYSVYFGTDSGGEPGTSQEQTVTYYDVSTPTGNGTNYLRVRTFDAAGNYTAPITLFTFKYDATNPGNPTAPAGAWDSSGKLIIISDGAAQNDDDTPYFEWSGAADLDSGVSGYSVYFGTSASGEPGTSQGQVPANYDVTVPTGNATNYLRVRTFDNAGNMSDAVTLFTLIYDNVKPMVTIVATPNPTGAIAVGALEFKLTFTESMNTLVTPTITYDPAGAAPAQPVATSGAWTTTTYPNDTYTVYNDNAITSSTGDGAAAISVTLGEDTAGNVMDADTNDTLTIDTAIDHFKIVHDGAGLISVAETVTITAQTQYGADVADYTGTMTVSTAGETGEITWALQTGGGTFNDGGAADDSATYTFVGGDNGVAVLEMTSSASDTLDIEVTDGTYVDDNSHGNMVVSTVALDHFVISHDNAGVAGTGETVTVTAKDAANATKTDYVGTITLDTDGTATTIAWALDTGQGTFGDGGGGSDTATYTFSINDNGVAKFTLTDTKVETVDIDCNDGAVVDNDTEGTMALAPAGIDHFIVAHDNAATAGIPDQVTVTAYDPYNNIKDDYTGTITLDTNGDVNAVTWAKVTGGGVFNDGGAGVDTATYTYAGGDNGVAVFTISDTKVQSIDIDVTGDTKTDTDAEGNMVVGPAGIDHFIVGHDNAANVGVADNVTVTAYDQYINIKTDYTGTITLDTNGTASTIAWAKVTGGGTFNDGGAGVDTATYTYVGGDNGTATFAINDTTEDTLDIDVTGDTKTDDDSEGAMVVGPPVISYFVISHDSVASAGVADNVTVTAKDSLGATMTGYTGTITLDTDGTATGIAWTLQTGGGTFNDGGASVDTATYTYVGGDNGVVVLTITDNTVEIIDIDVSGNGKTDDESEGTLNVGNPVLDHFVVGHDGTATAGTAGNVTVTAVDSIGGTKTDYTGTITVDTNGTATAITWAKVTGGGTFNDGGALVDTATYTYVGGDNGVVTLSINDTQTETIDIDVSGDAKTDDDTEGNLVVNAGAIDHFVVGHDNSALVNIAEPVTVTAKDVNENTITDYTGTITMDTTGTATTITWALQSGGGTFNDGGASVDTATYTYVSGDNGVVTLTITNTVTENVNISAAGDTKTDDDTEGSLDFTTPSDIVIDNLDAGYTDAGPNWQTKTGGTEYGTNWRRDLTHNDGGYARWTPTILTAGNYNVSCMGRSPVGTLATDAPFTVYYDGGNATTLIDQQVEGNPNWSLLGAYRFAAGTAGYVQLDDTTATTLDFSADVCKFELKGIANAGANAVTTGTVAVGSTDNLILDVTVTNQHAVIDTVTAVTVNNVGTAADSEISSVKLYYDSNDSGDYTSGVDTQVGSGTFSSGAKTFSGLSVNVAASGGAEKFFVILDVATTAADAKTLDVEIPADGIALTNAGLIMATSINSTGTRELDIVLDHFLISHDTAAIAGSDENITITAKDAYNNTKTDYTGIITVDTSGTATTITWGLLTGSGTFLDGGAPVDTATYTYSGADNGVVTLTLNDTLAETLNVSASGDSKTDNDAEGNLVVFAGVVDHFVIGHDTAATAGTAENVTVTVKDAFENSLLDYTGTITLDTNGTAAAITWTLLTGSGTFNDDGPSVDTATYTYAGSDDGAATFTMIDDVAETINISVSGDSKIDDNTEGNLVVSPAGLSHFVVAHDNSATAGTAENVTITAKDTLGNNKTDYTGTITADTNGTVTAITWGLVTGGGTFNDGGASVDTATYTYTGTDNGVVTLSLNDTKTETINVGVSGDTKIDEDTEGDLVIHPGAVDHFGIGHDGTGVTGVTETVTVTAYDANGNIKTDYAGTATLDTNGTPTTIAWTLAGGNGTFLDGGSSVDTATYTYDISDNGAASFGLNDTTADNLNIAVTGDGKTDDDTEGLLNIQSSGIDHFRVIHDGNGIVSNAENITIQAENANNDVITTYGGSIAIDTNGTAAGIAWALVTGSGTFNDGGAGVDTATYTFTGSDNGAVVLSLTDTTEETINISVSGEGQTDENTEGDIIINPAGLHHFKIVHDGGGVAGVADTVTVTAEDANGTVVDNYTGQITMDTTGTATTIVWAKTIGNGAFADGGPSADTATYTYVGTDNGVVVLTITDNKVETIDIDVAGGGKTDDGTEGTMTIGPGAIDHFVLTHDGVAVAGVADNVTVRAEDAYNNVKTNYTGQITMDTDGTATTIVWAKVTGNGTFLDGGASVDTAAYTFTGSDNGQVTLSLSDTVAETLNISSTGDTKTDNDSEGALIVGPADIDHFVIAHDGAAVAGVADNVTVTAYDNFNNVKTDYAGTITMDTNGTPATITWAKVTGGGSFVDGGAGVDTATYTYIGGDNGVVVLAISDTKKETMDIDAAGSGKTDNDAEGNFVVGPAAIGHFVITHDGSAEAGVADNVTIKAYDIYSNLKNDYTGTITMDTNGTATTITWAKVTGGGAFVDGGAGVDTATYTYIGADNGVAVLSLADTVTETIDIDASGDSKVDDDSEANMVIGPAAINDFVVAHDGTGITNSAEPVTITVRDTYQNIKTNYTGTITVSTTGETGEIVWALTAGSGTFLDNGAGSDSATYTFVTPDAGVVELVMTSDASDTVNVAVSGDGKTDEDTEGNLVFSSDSIVIDNLDAGYSEPVGTWANSTNGNEYSSNWRLDNSPGGGSTARWTPNIEVAGNYEVFAYWTTGGGALATDAPYTMTHVGGPTTVDVNQDANGNMWNSLGTFEFAAGSGGYVELSDDANNDVCADAIKWELRGSADATASSVTTASVAAGESNVVVLDVTVSNNFTDPDTITAVTVNRLGTISDAEIASVKLYYDSNNSGDYTPGVDTEAGTGTFASGTKTFNGLNITLPGSGTEDLFAVLTIANTVNDGDTLDAEIPIDGIVLANAPDIGNSAINSTGTRAVAVTLDHFVITHDGAGTAGVADNVTVTVKDQYDNTKVGYTGVVTLDTDGTATGITWAKVTGNGSFVDGGASVDTATYTFVGSDSGVAIFSIADNIAETVNISVSGDGKTDNDTEGDFVVSAAGLDHFVIVHDNNATAGAADDVSVTAKDAYENTVDNYTGTVTLDTDGTATTITWALTTGFGTFNDGGASADTATYTFSSSDNSTAVFTITDTVAETLDISVTGDTKSDDNTEGALVVATDNIDHFVIAHDGTAEAGVADSVTMTAKDQYGNTLPNYTGTITVDTGGTATAITWAKVTGNGTFNDGGPSVDTATYTYAGSDNGVVVLSVADTSLENLNISVSGDTKADDDTEGTLNVGPGLVETFVITHDGLANQNVAENITIKAYDAYTNIKTDYTGTITVDTNGTATTITWAKVTGDGTFNDGGAGVDTATYTFVGSDNGSVVLSMADTTAEIINISVSGDAKTDDDNEGDLDVVAAGFHHFKITHDGKAVDGVDEQITIAAKDASDVTVTNYTGLMTVDTNGNATTITWGLDMGNGTFLDGGASVDTATYQFVASDNGVVVLTVNDTSQETINISASGSSKTDDDTEGVLVIYPPGIDHFSISHDNAAVTGVADNVTITARDANDAAVTDYTGTITVDTTGTAGTIAWALGTGSGTFNDGGAGVDTATYTYVGGDSGVVVLTITDTTAETLNVSAAGSGKADEDTEGDIVVAPAGIDHFVIAHDGNAEAGVADSVTITAKDQYENTIDDYAGTITVDTDGTATAITWALTTGGGTFNDGGPSVDTATYTYVGTDNGVVVLNVTDTVLENLNISVAGDTKTDDNTEGTLNVGAGVLDKFIVTHDTTATAGVAESVTVTAYDVYTNIKTNYAGTITLDTNGTATAITWGLTTGNGTFNDGGAPVDTATYTYAGSDNGVAVFTITDTKAESMDIDISGGGKLDDDSEGNLVVSATAHDHFTITHDSSATAGTADNITITTKDTYENTITNYTGMITVDTTGAPTTITWFKVTGGGTFNDGGASVDTATYTYTGTDNGVVTLSINDTTAETINISASGNGKNDDNTEGDMVVNPDVLNYFVITHDNVAIQSVAESMTVTAKDQYANIKTDYTGEITLDTDGTATTITWALNTGAGTFLDGGASVDTATYTFAGADSGVAIFDMTDDTAEVINIAVSDAAITDDNTEGTLDVQASSTTVDGAANLLPTVIKAQNATDLVVLDATLTNNSITAADTLQSVTIQKAGTITDSDISAVKLYYDSNNSGDYTPGVDAQAGTGTFSAGAITFSSLNITLPIAGTEDIYVIYNLDGSVTDGATVDARIPVNGMSFANAPDTEDVILNSSGIYTIDSLGPTDVSALASSSHTNAISAWNDPQSKDNTIQVGWTAATDSGSGLDGYSVVWDTIPATLPDTVKDIEDTITTQTSTALSDGIAHYFHVRSVDNVGNWASTAQHLGPFYIDVTAPASLSIYQISEYAGGDYIYVSDVDTIYYSGLGYLAFIVYVEAADVSSGLNRAVFPSTVSAGGTDSTPAGGLYEFQLMYEVSSPGLSYNAVNVTVYDNAGNSATVPFDVILDNTPPNTVTTLSSSSHVPSVSSSDNDVTFTWSDVTDAASGMAGYNMVVDSSATTVPPKYKTINTSVQTYTENNLVNGSSYYGHIRPVDNVGNWGTTAHDGLYIIGRGSLTATITSNKATISTGQEFTVTMNVSNTGSSTVNNVDPSVLTVNATGGASAATSSDPTASGIFASNNKDFVWTYTAGASTGTINFEGSAQGTDQEGTITSSTVKSADIFVEDKTSLTVSTSASPTTANVSETITVTVTMTNSGEADALNVAPSLAPSGAASPVVDTGPTPSSATIKGGQSQSFTFTAHGIAAGTATFTADISTGTDENSSSNLTVTTDATNVTVEAATEFELTSSISATPTAVNQSGTITVTMDVQNTGTATVNSIAPSTLTVGGTSSDASLSTGPTPASVSSLASGATQQFTWTYTAGTTLGTVNFTGNGVGTEASSTSTSSGNVTIQVEAAALTSSIAVSPTSGLTNSTITVTMTVQNTAASGGATANSVVPSILTVGGTSGEANILTGSIPVSANISAGASQNFVWTYKAGTTAGTINFTGNASGTDSNSLQEVSSSATASGDVTIATLTPSWTYPTGTDTVGPIRSVPIGYNVMTDYVYFGSDDNNMYILDGTTHGLVSSFTASGDIRGLPYPSTEIKGVDFTDIVYFGTLGNTVYALWADNTLHWERILGEPLSTAVLYDYVSSVFFGTQAGNVYSLDAADGTDTWVDTTTVGGAIEAAPSLIFVPTLDYDEVYFGSNDGKMYGFKAADGTGSRTFDTGFGAAGAIKTAPVIVPQGAKRLMFFGSDNGRFYAVNVANMSITEADTGWATNPVITGGAIQSAPWVEPQVVYFGCQDGKLYALSRVDGTMMPNFPIDVGSPIDSWPIVYNDVVYFGADDGNFYAADVDTGQILPGWPYDTGGAIKGGAALHQIFNESFDLIDVFILIGSDAGKLYSFEDQ